MFRKSLVLIALAFVVCAYAQAGNYEAKVYVEVYVLNEAGDGWDLHHDYDSITTSETRGEYNQKVTIHNELYYLDDSWDSLLYKRSEVEEWQSWWNDPDFSSPWLYAHYVDWRGTSKSSGEAWSFRHWIVKPIY